MAELTLRDLEVEDLDRGLLKLLGQLTSVGDADRETQVACVEELLRLADVYKVVVFEDPSTSRIVATARLVVERKLTRGCGKCGHIEDVVVDAAYRGRRLGQRLLDSLVAHARRVGCYKVILDCAESNVPFYEKCGMTRKEVQMARYLQ